MSDVSQGTGWWVASDGKWYPPESHPDFVSPSSKEARAAQKEQIAADLAAHRIPLGVGTVDGNQMKGRIFSDTEGLWFEPGTGTSKPHQLVAAWMDASSVTVTGNEEANLKTKGAGMRGTVFAKEQTKVRAVTELVIVAGRHHSVLLEASPSRIRGLLGEVIGQVESRSRAAAHAASPVSVADELLKLANLRDLGILSDEEFDMQKARLLSG